MTADRILVVDDDEAIRQIVSMCLTDEGYDVFQAANGLVAIEVLEQVQPSLILLDLRMPVMDGWEFARRYCARRGPHAPIVAFVAAFNPGQECAEIDSAGILTKPFELDELLDAVRSQLAARSISPQLKT